MICPEKETVGLEESSLSLVFILEQMCSLQCLQKMLWQGANCTNVPTNEEGHCPMDDVI